MNKNFDLARGALDYLNSQGCEDFVVCAGSRNSPLVVLLLQSNSLSIYNYFEERSAAFFALGLAKRQNRPVAVVTTSGTACAEMLPAVIEAHYSRIPLVALSADRPHRFRGSGAPQCIEQAKIFEAFVQHKIDLDGDWVKPEFCIDGPLHINLCFDEPLLQGAENRTSDFRKAISYELPVLPAVDSKRLDTFLSQTDKPLIIAGEILPSKQNEVKEFLLKLKAPVYLEALSGLREDSDLASLRIKSGDRFLGLARFDSVLRIGGIPTLRFWRDLENVHATLPVMSIDEKTFSGLGRKSDHMLADLSSLRKTITRNYTPRMDLLSLDEWYSDAIKEILARERLSEPALIHALSRVLPNNSKIYLGNSLPIREWDLVAEFRKKKFFYHANRGANGIDGQVSSFFGGCDLEKENWALIGDLTALYDMSAPWILQQLPEFSMNLCIINNQGGKIFSRLSHLQGLLNEVDRTEVFENSHRLNFESLASFWNLPYEQWSVVPASPAGSRQRLIEINPDPESTENFWRSYELLWNKS